MRWSILSRSLPPSPNVAVTVDYFGPLLVTLRENSYKVPTLHGYIQPTRWHVRRLCCGSTVEGTTYLLVNKVKSLRGCAASLLSDNGQLFSSKLSLAE